MPRAVQGRDLGAKLVQALGLPTHDCLGAQLLMPAADVAEVVVRYKLTDEALAKLTASLAGGEPGRTAARSGSNGPAPGHRPAPPPNPPAGHGYQPADVGCASTPPGAE